MNALIRHRLPVSGILLSVAIVMNPWFLVRASNVIPVPAQWAAVIVAFAWPLLVLGFLILSARAFWRSAGWPRALGLGATAAALVLSAYTAIVVIAYLNMDFAAMSGLMAPATERHSPG